MIEITVLFGSYKTGSKHESFSFETKAEADAFMTGVVSAEGWTGYTILHDNRSGKDTGSERGLPEHGEDDTS